jgi:OOP family OmpA-OmpF porin
MKKFIISAAMCASVLAGCAYSGVKELSRLNTSGDDFSAFLATEYKHYAMFEANEMADWKDAEYFAQKGLAAANGQNVMPSELAERQIPEFAIEDLASAREKLMSALQTLDTPDNYANLAKAQTSFDCWMEQQEENIQPNHIADCRVQFQKAMEDLNVPHVILEEHYRVFFAHDSDDVDAEAMAVIEKAEAFIGDMVGSRIVLTGGTDTTGSESYNMKLSEARAKAVYDAMLEAGIPEHKVEIMAKGEADLLVETQDNVNEPKNRRVDILIVR